MRISGIAQLFHHDHQIVLFSDLISIMKRRGLGWNKQSNLEVIRPTCYLGLLLFCFN